MVQMYHISHPSSARPAGKRFEQYPLDDSRRNDYMRGEHYPQHQHAYPPKLQQFAIHEDASNQVIPPVQNMHHYPSQI